MFEQINWSLSKFFAKRAGVQRSNINTSNYQYLVDRPAWLSLKDVHEYRQAVAENPVLSGCISILANAAANGKKYLVDLNGKEIPWNSGKTGVKNARKLFIERPNPMQSVKEFNYEREYMFFTYGNNYVYLNNPLETYETDIINVVTMCNLPSEFVNPRQTGKFFDQVAIEGIIEKYALIDRTPIIEFDTNRIIHFNDINTSGVGNSIMGTSRLEVLRYPITNTQLAFEAMNVILKNRGMNGIISPKKLDGMGASMPLTPDEEKKTRKEFKNDYGLRDNQEQYMLSPVSLDFYKTSLNSSELGIYKEFSNNAMIISNGFGIPPELYKTYMEGATFENQVQSERRLYQNTIIPLVENEDQYYTERLNMRKYGFELKTDFSHISCLQEGRKENATSLSMNGRTGKDAYDNDVITWNQYLALLELEPVQGGDVYKSGRVVKVNQDQNQTQ